MRESSEIPCRECGAPAGVDCANTVPFNHIGRGIDLAVKRSPWVSVNARTTERNR